MVSSLTWTRAVLEGKHDAGLRLIVRAWAAKQGGGFERRAPDKDAVLAEAFRVLKPGGRLAVSDVVVRGEVPPAVRKSVELWIGCIAGALEESDYRVKLQKAGFEAIDVEPTRVYGGESARERLSGAGLDAAAIAAEEGKFISAFIRARKPSA